MSKDKKAVKCRTKEKRIKIQEAISLVIAGYSKADAYRQAFEYKGRRAPQLANQLFNEPDVQDMLECAKQRAAQQIAERTIWTKEQATETLKGVIKECSAALQKKMNMPAVIGLTNAVKELNAMNNLTGKDINVSQSTVIFQDESKLED